MAARGWPTIQAVIFTTEAPPMLYLANDMSSGTKADCVPFQRLECSHFFFFMFSVCLCAKLLCISVVAGLIDALVSDVSEVWICDVRSEFLCRFDCLTVIAAESVAVYFMGFIAVGVFRKFEIFYSYTNR